MQTKRDTLTWSYGGGTQSVAIAVLVARGRLPRPNWIGIADTGRESTETWEYTDRYVQPLLGAVGLQIERIPHERARLDLYGNNGDLLIPAWTQGGILPTFCSGTWKKEVINKRLRELGYGPKRPVVTWLGISLDEIGRAKPSGRDWQLYAWPLLWHVPALHRADCYRIVEEAGLPRPPKSSCWMCPFRKNEQWAHQREQYPEDHAKACEFDDAVRARDRQSGVYVHFSRKPLREADLTVPDPPESPLFGQVAGCDSGYCWV